jgi:CubicO group peptidase (beta-lactamase class C family)
MVKKVYVIFMVAACSLQTMAQTTDQIKKVENGLIPYVPVKGFPSWNIYQRMKYYHVKGVSIAVIKDYKLAWAKGYGLADTARNMSVTTKTMFSAGSISKFLAAAVAMCLVEQNKLQLDSPVNHYLRSWKIGENDFTRKKPVTLRMLLSHTAGTSQTSYFGFTPDKKPLPRIVEILSGQPIAESRPVVVNSEPGKEFRYSGGGTMVAQMAMMDVTGMEFDSLSRQLLFEPLGMENSTFEQPLPAKFTQQLSWGYSAAPWYKGTPYVYPQQAAAGLYTTPTDLARFIIDIQQSYMGRGKLLHSSTVSQMLTPQAQVSQGMFNEQIGVGPFLLQLAQNKEEEGRYFEFTGVNAGFTAYVIGSLTGGNGAVVMLNTGDDNNGLGMEIRRAIARSYNWYHFLPDEIRPVKVSESKANEYTGRYRKGPDEVVVISREKDYFVERINDGPKIYCFPTANDELVLTDFDVKATFRRGTGGQITGLQTAYQDVPMPKMTDKEFSPRELLRLKKYTEAITAYEALHLNEYQLTYMIYDLLNVPGSDRLAILALLKLAKKTFPSSPIVYARWGDFYKKMNDRTNALTNYKTALSLQPDDKQLQDLVIDLINKR